MRIWDLGGGVCEMLETAVGSYMCIVYIEWDCSYKRPVNVVNAFTGRFDVWVCCSM